MPAMPPLPARRFGPADGGPPRQIVFVLHGLGANGADLAPLAQALAPAAPGALFLMPDAPEPCDLVSPEEGQQARQWFSLGDWSPAAMARGVRRGLPALDRFVDESLAEHRLPAAAYALAGFSQGAMMALFCGLRRRPPPAAILAFSGILLDPAALPAEIGGRPRVLLAHGQRDEVVPAAFSRAAAETLGALGLRVTLDLDPALGHAIDSPGIAAGRRLLAEAFSGAPAGDP
ncbi:alpha/beta hydrolase [Acidisoma sp. C75]